MRKSLYLLCDLKYLASLPLLALQPQSPSQLKSMWLKKINTYIFSCTHLNKDVYLIGAAPGGIPIGWGRIAASHTAPLLAPLLCPE